MLRSVFCVRFDVTIGITTHTVTCLLQVVSYTASLRKLLLDNVDDTFKL
jgi:hypothetical protein